MSDSFRLLYCETDANAKRANWAQNRALRLPVSWRLSRCESGLSQAESRRAVNQLAPDVERHHQAANSPVLRPRNPVIVRRYNPGRPFTSGGSMTALTRRSFLATLGTGLAAAPGLLRARSRSARYPIAFSTLGCPSWRWKTILENADKDGYAALELRGVAGEMDLPKVPEFIGTRLAETKRDLAALGIVVSDLGASARMHEKDPAVRAQQFDEGRRFIDLAQSMGVKYVRVFGDKIPEGESKDDVMNRVVEGFRTLADYAKPAGVTVLIESHGDFTRSADLEAILTRAASPQFALLWDAHHSFVAAGEQPADTFAKIGKWTRHTHLKDSKPGGASRRYVLLGTGEVPVERQVKVLAAAGYQGFYGFEWEKKWQPEIEEPEIAFPHYAKTMAEYLSAAGVKAT
jgi:sugar phosphate isomerase/epimerase